MTQIQIKRGLEANRSSVTPAAGELLYTTDDKKVYVGDGTTAGGNPVAASGASIEATASGALANGDMVVVNSDGTVSVVAGAAASVGSATVFNAASSQEKAAVYDSASGKVVITYVGTSNYGYAVVGTVSGTSITFGTPVLFDSNWFKYPSIVYDSGNSVVVISYRNEINDYGYSIVGTVSGTSISFGSPVMFRSPNIQDISSAYDPVSGKIIIAFYYNATNGQAIVGTVSGTSISFGSSVTFDTGDVRYTQTVYDTSNDKIVIIYSDSDGSNYGRAIVGTVSGTSISFGTSVIFNSDSTLYNQATYDASSGKILNVFASGGSSAQGIVGTVSGTSISFGSAVTFNNENTFLLGGIAFDASAGKTVIAFRGSADTSGKVVECQILGTTPIFSTPIQFDSDLSNYACAAYDATNEKVVVAYTDNGNSSYGTSFVYSTSYTNLTATNFIGVSDGTYADTTTATVQIIGGVDDAQTGLTAGQAYYVQGDGSLSTTPDSISVFAGTAISATNIIVKG